MANRIVPKKSSVAAKVPLATDLVTGEIAINLADKILYSKDASGNIITIGGSTGGVTSFNTRTGDVTLSSTDVTTALGFTPYNATNPDGYITSAALSPYLTSATAASTYQTIAGMSSYLTTATAASTYQTLSGMSSYLTTANAASTYQPLDGDLTAIAGLSGTSGLLKKTGANTWALDTSAYLTGITSSDVTTALGYTPLSSSSTLDASKLSGTIPSAVLGNSTVYIGTTAVALNRTSASLSLTGVSIDGNAATATNADTLDGNHASAFALVGQTMYIGTTAVAINRASASLSLTGVSIDGSAGSALTATTATNATNVGVTDDTSNASTHYVALVAATSGNANVKIDSTGLTFVPSTGNFTAAGNVTAYSDERLKTGWRNLPFDFVEQLAELLSGTFIRIDTGERQVGVGAQSLQRILPEAVMTGEDGTLSVAYGNAAMAAVVALAKRVIYLEQQMISRA